MKLFVQNLGVVSEAEIDLSKDFILFTGQNNTGKTYLAYLVYMVNKNSLGIRGFLGNKTISFYKDNILDLKNAFSENQEIKEIERAFAFNIKKYLQFFFSTSLAFFQKTSIALTFEKYDFSHDEIKDIEDDRRYLDYKIVKNKGSFDVKFIEEDLDVQHDIRAVMESFLIDLAYGLIQKNTIIFPSMREGISLFHKELSMIKNKVFDGLSNGNKEAWFNIAQRFNRYPQPIKDTLEFAQNLDVIRKNQSEFAYLADELETAFLGGKVEVNSDGDLQFLLEDKQVLEIHMASSTVKSLSYLAIYLRHSAKKGDFIIIDEPELNLHPDNQRKIARFFGRLINEGFKVLISTHSDYIVREVNNLIMLNSGFEKNEEATTQLLAKHNYSKNQLLDKNRVGAYLFKMGEKVQSLSVDETGFSVPTIDDEIQKLNQTTNDILFELFD